MRIIASPNRTHYVLALLSVGLCLAVLCLLQKLSRPSHVELSGKVKANMLALQLAVSEVYRQTGAYPESLNGLTVDKFLEQGNTLRNPVIPYRDWVLVQLVEKQSEALGATGMASPGQVLYCPVKTNNSNKVTDYSIWGKVASGDLVTISIPNIRPLVLVPAGSETRNQFEQRIHALELEQQSTNSRSTALTVGRAYADIGELKKAIIAYKDAAPPLPWGKGQIGLLDAWKDLDGKSPFDPEIHLGLGHAFVKWGYIGQAELEFRQAQFLSPNHQNAEASKLLTAIANKDILPPKGYTTEGLNEDLLKNWRPPMHEGLLLTRCFVLLDTGGNPSVSLIATSGNKDYDQSVVKSLETAANYRPFTVRPCFIDVGYLSEGQEKRVEVDPFYSISESPLP